MDYDFAAVIGPEFEITFSKLSKQQIHELATAIGLNEKDDDAELSKSAASEIVTDLCEAMEGFIIAQKSVHERIKVEPESSPFASVHPDELVLFGSINVCYEDAYEELSAILYSGNFEEFFEREALSSVSKRLGPLLPWLAQAEINVQIQGIGES